MTKKQKDEEQQNPAIERDEEILLLSKAEVDELKEALATAQKKEQENLESWQRERADFVNFRKRMERDQEIRAIEYKLETLKKFIPILDDMELAMRNIPTAEEDATAWAKGIELIAKKINTIMESEGLKKIDIGDGTFDPNFEQAISYEEDPDVESGKIIEVFQTGYQLGERVIRPALVRVAK